MHTYIQAYKNKWKYSRLYIGLFGALTLFGVVGLGFTYVFKRPFIPALDPSNYIFITLYGIMTCFIIWDSMKRSRYFVEWDNSTIKYLLPGAKETELIELKKVK